MTTPDTMTDPHVEAVARAIDPVAFETWYHAPRGMEFFKPSQLKAEQERRKSQARKKATAAIAAYRKSLEDAGFVIVPYEATLPDEPTWR